MCWKYEWARAVNNLTDAIIHVERARRKIHARLLRNKRTLEKLSHKHAAYASPKSLARVKELINKNRNAEQRCIILIEDFKEGQKQLRHLLDTYGIKRGKKSRMAEKLMKGKRVKAMVSKKRW